MGLNRTHKRIIHTSSPDLDTLLVDIVRSELRDVRSIERNSPVLFDIGHDLPVGYLPQVAGLQVLGKHRLSYLPSQPILGAQGPVVEVDGLRHVLRGVVAPEPPDLGNGPAALHPAPGHLDDRFDDLLGHQLLYDAVGGCLGHPELYLEQPGGGRPGPAEVDEGLPHPWGAEDTPTRRQYFTISS